MPFQVCLSPPPSPSSSPLPLPQKNLGNAKDQGKGDGEWRGDRDPGAFSPENRIQEWRQNCSCELYNHCSFKGENWNSGCHSVCRHVVGKAEFPALLAHCLSLHLPHKPLQGRLLLLMSAPCICVWGGGAGGQRGNRKEGKGLRKGLSCTKRRTGKLFKVILCIIIITTVSCHC